MDGLQSPILKFLEPQTVTAILDRVGAADGDIVFFGADTANIVNDAMGAFRDELGRALGLVESGWAPLWVTEFPMFEPGRETLVAAHHPFTQPACVEQLRSDPAPSARPRLRLRAERHRSGRRLHPQPRGRNPAGGSSTRSASARKARPSSAFCSTP